jgi:WD40 repeat protein
VVQLRIAVDGSDTDAEALWEWLGDEPALWDTTGQTIAVFTGHSGPIHALSYHPDGKTVASAGEDHTIRRWQLATGRSTTLTGHTAAVLGVTHDPDGTLRASAGEDATARIWNTR